MRVLKKICVLLVLVAMSELAGAQSYPGKPVRIINAFPPGGPTDLMSRAIGPKLGESLGQPVIVEYKPGANARIGTDYVAKSAADGYTLLLIPPSHLTNPSTQKNLPYDSLKDFTGVSPVAHGDVVLLVNPKLPINSVKELVALAKSRPGKLNYASATTGGSLHLGAELLKLVAGFDMLMVPYNGAGPALQDLIAGTADLMFVSAAPAIAQIRAGRVRLIAVASLKRSSSFPDTPTVVEAGYAKFEIGSDYGIIAPAATPRPVINRLNGALEKILATPEVRPIFAGLGVEPWWDTPEQYTTWIRDEVEKWAAVARAIKYQPE